MILGMDLPPQPRPQPCLLAPHHILIHHLRPPRDMVPVIEVLNAFVCAVRVVFALRDNGDGFVDGFEDVCDVVSSDGQKSSQTKRIQLLGGWQE